MRKRLFKRTPSNSYIRIPAGSEKADGRAEVPQGIWKKCNQCGKPVFTEDVKAAAYICPHCGGYFRMNAWARIHILTDQFEEWDQEIPDKNPLGLSGYAKKLESVREKTGLDEAVVTGKARIGEQETVLGVMDGRFIMGSMGEAVGEKITRAVERATKLRLPVILFCCSGGARMQEGILSLMQMAKTAAALRRHSDAGLLYVPVLTEPTMGGVTASFAMLGDLVLAEPGARIGFAGPRVIEQTIGETLPVGFQRAEFLLEHGFIDRILYREEAKQVLEEILRFHADNRRLPKSAEHPEELSEDRQKKRIKGSDRAAAGKEKGHPFEAADVEAWARVCRSRDRKRPTALDYIEGMFESFTELHGDRLFGEDPAVVGGLAWFRGIPVTVIGQQKGRSTKENVKRSFGMPSPEGYRKTKRLMEQAEKFGRPVICFVDTPGAFCGIGAEERGQGAAIAENLKTLAGLKVPVLSIVIGEGGSGGALALAQANEVWILENAVYSILSPEGFASIVWKDSGRAAEAAGLMKLTAGELYEQGIVDRVIPENVPADRADCQELYRTMEEEIGQFLDRFGDLTPEELCEQRYRRFRGF